jgi:hypothetical protein
VERYLNEKLALQYGIPRSVSVIAKEYFSTVVTTFGWTSSYVIRDQLPVNAAACFPNTFY